MSYIFLPPRTGNFFPPGPPYLSGLGDYASDYAAYKKAWADYEAANKKWLADKKKFDADLTTYLRKISDIDKAYVESYAYYLRDKKAWDGEKATYDVAMNNWGRNFSAQKKINTAAAQTVAQSYGLKLPQSFYDNGACISAADQAYYKSHCTVVKGLGSYGSDCGMRLLPVCNFGDKPTLRAQPQPPAKPKYPTKPTLRAQPTAPTILEPTKPVVTTPVLIPITTTPSPSVPGPSLPQPTAPEETPTAEDSKQANLVRNGLLLVAVLGGGYLVYRTLKKPKAA